jgi:competence protein ComEC
MQLRHALALLIGICLALLPGSNFIVFSGLDSATFLRGFCYFSGFASLLLLLALWRRWQLLSFLAIALLGAGYASYQARSSINSRLAHARSGEIFSVQGQVLDLPEINADATRLTLLLDGSEPVGKVRISWYGAPPLQTGERWALQVKLTRSHGLANPGGFDFERYAVLNSIDAIGYVQNSARNHRLYDALPWRAAIRAKVDQLRARMSAQISTLLPSSRQRALLQALAVGDTRQISDPEWQTYRQLGVTHLIAISGLHVTFLATLGAMLAHALLWIFPTVTRIIPRRQICAGVGLSCALMYTVLSGFNVPAVRTLLMLAAILLGILLRRVQSLWQGYALALITLLLVDPKIVLSAGAWLSFVAVALLICVRARQIPKPSWLRELLGAQLLMSVGLLPLSLIFFQQFSLLAPLVNLIAIPLVSLLVVPLVLAAVVLLLFAPQMAQILLQCAEWLLRVGLLACDWLQQTHWATLLQTPVMQTPMPWTVTLALFGILLWFAPRGVPLRRFAFVLLLPMLIPVRAPTPPEGEIRMSVLDVGQGLSVLVQTREHALLFDTGPDARETGQGAIGASLAELGVRQLDQIIVSHADMDHSAGLPLLRDEFVGTPIVTSALEKIANSSACQAGMHWAWNGVQFRFLHPNAGLPYLANQSSCVLKISGAHGSVLLPGDIDDVIESRLLRTTQAQLPADILLAPHHGSAGSSSEAFLAAVMPKHVIYAVGYSNRFGFPRAQTQVRVRATGAKEWLTSDSGALIFESSAAGWRSAQWRELQPRWWRDSP